MIDLRGEVSVGGLRKYVRQIEDYMYSPSVEPDTMQGTVQFRRRALVPGRAELVERTLTDRGISCVWLDGE